MSSANLTAALGIWRARKQRTGSDKAYVLYAFVWIAIVVAAPVVRLLWRLSASPSGVALLTATAAPIVVSLFTVGLWAGALLLGRSLGPALMPPFLLHTLVESNIHRHIALRGPLIRAGTIIVFVLAGSAVVIGVALASLGLAQIWEVTGFVAAAAAMGVITTVGWLTGQALPRTAALLAFGILAVTVFSVLSQQVIDFVPWGWVGATYPLSESIALPLAGVIAFALLVSTVIPRLLNMLTGTQLSRQSVKWERATMFSFTLEFGAAVAVYETHPRLGRHFRAIRVQRQRAFTFFFRDVIGQLRTPVRCASAIGATVVAGIAVTLSFVPGAPTMLLAGMAGLMAYTSSGTLAQGLRHAADVAGDYPLYGISDRTLMFLHTLFPFITVTATITSTAVVTALLSGVALNAALAGGCAFSLLILAVRLSSALKSSLPPRLLTPINSPAGDLSIFMQLGWVLSDLSSAVLGGVTVALLLSTPIPFLLLSASVTALLVLRWKKRR